MVPGSIGLSMSVAAFVLGTAPFTPALVFAIVAVPIALLSLYQGVWRLAAASLYWAFAAFLSSSLLDVLQVRVDYLLLILGGIGIVGSLFLFADYMRKRHALPQ